MKVKWLLEKDVFQENTARLAAEITVQGHVSIPVEYIPFGAGKYDHICTLDDCVIFYGSLNMMRQLQRQNAWIPGGWCNLPDFRCQKYYPHFGNFLLNQDYMMMPLVELIRQKDFVYKCLGVNNEIFVRPDSGFKEFTGGVVCKDGLSFKALGFGYYHEDPSLLVVVSSPKQIQREWRLVVCKKKVISWSGYKIDGQLEVQPDVDEAAIKFANEIQGDWQPDPIYVMDICLSGGRFWLLELNSFSCSGLYDCDVAPIVREASALAIEECAV